MSSPINNLIFLDRPKKFLKYEIGLSDVLQNPCKVAVLLIAEEPSTLQEQLFINPSIESISLSDVYGNDLPDENGLEVVDDAYLEKYFVDENDEMELDKYYTHLEKLCKEFYRKE